MIYIVYGVSGSGKSTVGKKLAQACQLPFYDADDFHPRSNVEKMQAGIPLVDADRWPWLHAMRNAMPVWEGAGGAVLACSALKEVYRSVLRGSFAPIEWILLHGPKELVAERLASRPDHFFNSILQESQFATLEIPQYGLQVDMALPVEQIVQVIRKTHRHGK